MSPFVLRFADGTVFLVGLAVACLAASMPLGVRNRAARPVFVVLALLGILLVVVSATPLPIWAYVIWIALVAACLVLFPRRQRPEEVCRACVIGLLLVTLLLALTEATYRRRPKVVVSSDATVYVLGDSISAGIGAENRCWPDVLDDMRPYRVVNLAVAGARLRGALDQARGITEPSSIVILEIGGNDLLGGGDAATFRAALDELVSSLRADGHRVLMLELPLFPFANAYGQAQRDVARAHGVVMVPKRDFARVFSGEGATVDGLHLTQTGHDAMARLLAEVLEAR